MGLKPSLWKDSIKPTFLASQLSPPYSVFKLFTGLANAAFIA
jgi:hypothetical protein